MAGHSSEHSRHDSLNDDDTKQLPSTSDSDSVSSASFQNLHGAIAPPRSRQGEETRTPKGSSTASAIRNVGINSTAAAHPLSGDPESTTTTTTRTRTATENTTAEAPASGPPAHRMEGSAPEDERTKLQTALIVVALCSAVLLAALDVTITTVAIPTISADFQSTAGYTWIGSAYLLANAAAAPSWGKLSDIFGRKPVLLTAVGVFWVGSLLCGVSVSMGMLIAGRAIQGIGGGGSLILVNICISDLFSVRKRGVYLGFVGLVWALAGGFGPGEFFPLPLHTHTHTFSLCSQTLVSVFD